MKKVIRVVLFICMISMLYGCNVQKHESSAEEGFVEQMKEWSNRFGKTQITEDESLMGKRTLENDGDYYIGSYVSDISHATGRDVIFGGAIIEERKIILKGTIDVGTGQARIRVRMNEEVVYLEPNESGIFEKEFSLESGGNYIMIDYENFTGNVELTCLEGDSIYEK